MKVDIIQDVLLDLENPRFEKKKNQNEALNYFADSPKTQALARDIVEHGFNPTESIIVMPENDSLTVLEGNRRCAAVKLLQNPEICRDEKTKQKYRDIAALGKVPTEVNAFEVDSREEARPWIERKHSGPLGGHGNS